MKIERDAQARATTTPFTQHSVRKEGNPRLMSDYKHTLNLPETKFPMRGEVNKALEAARVEKRIGSSLQAEMTLFAKPELAARLNALADELRFVLLTSKAKVVMVDSAPEGSVATERDDLWLCVAQSEAAKCDRCWHHVEDVGTIKGHEEICGRCVISVEGDGETRHFA